MQRDAVLYNSLTDAMETASGWRGVLTCMQSMAARQIQFDPASSTVCTLAIAAIIAKGRSTFMQFWRIVSEVATKAFAQGSFWQTSLLLLDSMPKNAIALSSAIGSCSGLWQQALCLLCTRQPVTAAGYTAAISSCRGGKWQVALCLLHRMKEFSFSPSAIAATAAITCCESSREWQQAVGILTMMLQDQLESDAIAYRATISCCSDADWQSALAILTASWRARIRDIQAYNKVLWACEAASAWQIGHLLLHEIPTQLTQLVPDEVSYLSVLRSCGRSCTTGAGVELLRGLMCQGMMHGISTLPSMLAAIFISDPDVIHCTLKETLERLRMLRAASSPHDLVTLWSSSAVLGAQNGAFEDAILVQIIPRLPLFDWDELVELSWGAAACGLVHEFFDPLQEELANRFENARHPPAQSVLALISACHSAGMLYERCREAASQLLVRQGQDLDGNAEPSESQQMPPERPCTRPQMLLGS